MPALPPDRPASPPPTPATARPPTPATARPRCPRAPGEAPRPGTPRPLPDPAAVRRCPIPDSAPPYDDETWTTGGSGTHVGHPGNQAGAAHAPASGGHGRDSAPAWMDNTGTSASPGPVGGEAGTVRPASRWPDAHEPETSEPGTRVREGEPGPALPGAWPSRFAQVLAETLAGSRPPRQMVPWTTEHARTSIQRLGPQLAAGERPRVRRVLTCRPARDVLEMTVVVGFGPRVRALAVRLEHASAAPAAPGRQAQTERWLCTAVEAA